MTSFADKCRDAVDLYFQKLQEEKDRIKKKLLEKLDLYAEQIAHFMLKKAAEGYVAYDICRNFTCTDYLECFFPVYCNSKDEVVKYPTEEDSVLRDFMENKECMEILAQKLRDAPYEFFVILEDREQTIALLLEWEKEK